jgi:hypothetical protein
MLAAVTDWVMTTYSEQVLSLLPGTKQTGGADPQAFIREVKQLAVGQTARAEFSATHFIEAQKQGEDQFSLKSSMMEMDGAGIAMVESMATTIGSMGNKGVQGLTDLEREAKTYARKGKDHGRGTSTFIDLDLTGWKYMRGSTSIVSRVNKARIEHNAALNKAIAEVSKAKATHVWFASHRSDYAPPGLMVLDYDLRYMAEKHQGDIDGWMEWKPEWDIRALPIGLLPKLKLKLIGGSDIDAALASSNWKGINVEVSFLEPGTVNFSGQWHDIPKRLSVVVAPPRVSESAWALKDFQRTIEEMSDTILHEVVHMAQSLLGALKGVLAGRPSKRTAPKSKTWDPMDYGGDRRVHHLDDREFYTLLTERVQQFKRKYRGRHTRRDIDTFLRGDDFFRMLKADAPRRWQKAVSVFITEVG